jgi:xylonate dehydratase
VGEGQRRFAPEEGVGILNHRATRTDLAPNAALPEDTRLWAALQLAGGGTWGGCVYDAEPIIATLKTARSRSQAG